MELKTLYRVVNHIRETSGNSYVIDSIIQISDLFDRAASNPNEDLENAIQKKIKELQSHLIKSDPVHWGHETYSYFRKINSHNLFGRQASDYLDKILNLDSPTAASEIKRFSQQYQNLIDNLNKFSLLFDSIIPWDQEGNDNYDRKLSLYLYFEGPLKIKSTAELDRYSRLWEGILGSFSNLTDENISSPEIYSFCNGNTVLGVNAGERTIKALMEGVSGILDYLPATLKIRQLQKDISDLNLNKSINALLDEEVIQCLENKANSVAEEISRKYSGGNYSDQLVVELSKSLKQVLSFIEKGGRLEFDPPGFPAEATNKLLNESLNLLQSSVN